MSQKEIKRIEVMELLPRAAEGLSFTPQDNPPAPAGLASPPCRGAQKRALLALPPLREVSCSLIPVPIDSRNGI